MLERIEAAVGSVALRGISTALRLRMRGQWRQHRDDRGRVTRWLSVGTARRGTVVWIHGFNDRPGGILRTALELWQDYRIVAPAVPGFFEGWVDESESHTVDAYGRWLAPVLREAVTEPSILVGNSLGGAIALELAAVHDLPVAGLIALNPAGMEVQGERSVIDDFAEGKSPFEIDDRAGVDQLFTRLLGRPVQVPFPFRAALYEDMRSQRAWYRRLGEDLAKSERRETGEGWASAIALSRIGVPAMVLWGERDTLFPVSHGEQLATSLPQGRLVRMPGVGHIAHVEAPTRLAAHIRQFAEGLGSV